VLDRHRNRNRDAVETSYQMKNQQSTMRNISHGTGGRTLIQAVDFLK
jgi:hypothetical protein